MTDHLPLTSAELADLKAKAKAATPGPYFAAEDEALDCPDHRKSGLALVDTGRREDWPIARLCEWNQARYIEATQPETILRLIAMIERRDAWQPIETAPKDGTEVLIWEKHEIGPGQASVASYQLEYSVPEDDATERRRFHQRGGFYNMRATHWQPLPAPPNEALAATEPRDE